MRPAIAVITPNILMGVGLRAILEKVIPGAEIAVFGSFAEFEASDAERYAHYFVAVQAFMAHSTFFLARRAKSILLGSSRSPRLAELRHIDTSASEEQLVHALLHLHRQAPHAGHQLPAPQGKTPDLLSTREEEVLTLIAQGLRNKQIADRLHISLTTVISHRRNIMEKLGAQSVAALVLYAVSMGYADADQA